MDRKAILDKFPSNMKEGVGAILDLIEQVNAPIKSTAKESVKTEEEEVPDKPKKKNVK